MLLLPVDTSLSTTNVLGRDPDTGRHSANTSVFIMVHLV